MTQASTNLIINYLPQSLTDEEFRSMFLSIGPLKASKIVRDRATGYSYGFGFVDYQTEEDAAKAISTLNGLQLQNKRIKVAYSRTGEKVKGANLYVKNLPKAMTQDQLQATFAKYGTIVQARIIVDQNTNQSKGVGFVLFESKDMAEEAMKCLDGQMLEGCSEAINVKFADDNAGKARPPPGPGSAPLPASRGGFTGTPYAAAGRGAYGAPAASNGFGPMRNRGGLNRYNPMSAQTATPGAMQAYGGGYGTGYSSFEDGTFGQNGAGGGGDTGGFVLFVYNIGPDADERALWQLFSPFGTIVKVNVIRDFQKNQGKGYGFVTMSTYQDAMYAIQQLNGYKYYGKPLQVSFKNAKNN